MPKKKACYQKPTAVEQQVLCDMTVRLVAPQEEPRFNQLLESEHYLKSARLVGRSLRYVAVWKGRWLGLATWSAPALHIKARDQFIGWTEEQRRQRLALVANNSRLCVLPDCHYPNLVSRFMKLMLGRLSADWQAVWGHPLAALETFVDPQYFRGTAYKVSGWIELGTTSGWKRSAMDFYEKHERPKQVWLRELVKNACAKLRAPTLPEPWASVAAQVKPRCTAKVAEITSLLEHLRREVTEFRSKKALAYPVAGMLALIAMAMFSGVAKGYEELEDYAATLSQGQLRALGFRAKARTCRIRCPKRTTFERVLNQADALVIERTLLLWQAQVLGPAQDSLVIFDGKTHRHAGVETVSAVSGSGRWLGSLGVPAHTTEVPVARQLIGRLDLVDKTVLADAAHTQVETAQQILFEGGGQYLLTVKENQKTLHKTLATLFTQQRFPPSAHSADSLSEPRTQLRTAGDPGTGLPGHNSTTGGVPGSSIHCPAQTPGAA